MNVSLAAQILSRSVCSMIRDEIQDKHTKLQIRNKNVYHYLANLCEKQDTLFDMTNVKASESFFPYLETAFRISVCS